MRISDWSSDVCSSYLQDSPAEGRSHYCSECGGSVPFRDVEMGKHIAGSCQSVRHSSCQRVPSRISWMWTCAHRRGHCALSDVGAVFRTHETGILRELSCRA